MDAMDLLSVPYVRAGRSLDGVDCYGLLIVYYRHVLEIELLDYPGTHGTDEENSNLFLSGSRVDWIRTDKLQQHNVVLFTTASGLPAHVGVMIDEKTVMQATNKQGCTCVRLARLKNKIHSIYRHRLL